MRTKKLKWGNPLFVIFLAIAGIFGISSALINKQNEKTQTMEKAYAGWGYHTSDYIYFDTGGFWSNIDSIKLLCTHRTSEPEKDCSYGATATSPLYGNVWKLYFPEYDNTNVLGICGYSGGNVTHHIWFDYLQNLDWVNYHGVPPSGTIVTQWGAGSVAINGVVDLTFKRNAGNDSELVHVYKRENVAFTIPTPEEIGMKAAGGRKFLRWYSNSSGTGGTPYEPGTDTYDSNTATTFYMIQDWYTYQYSNDNGLTWVDMNKTNESQSGYDALFAPDSNQVVRSGYSLTFRRYYQDESNPEDIGAIGLWEGDFGSNYDTVNQKVIYTFTGKIHVKVTHEDASTINVPGYSQRFIAVYHGSQESKYHLSWASDTDYYTTVPVTLYPGDYILTGWDDGEYPVSYIPSESEGDCTYGAGRGDAHSPGVFYIHVLKGDYQNWQDIKLTMVNDATANLFASTFNSEVGSDCAAITGNTGSFNDLLSTWGSTSSDENTMFRYYNSLTSEAKSYLVSDDSGSTIDLMVKKYDYILSKYGYGSASGQLKDFMSRTPAPLSTFNNFTLGSLFGESSEESLSTIIIIAASGVALLSITALSVLAIKKRKNKEE